MESTKQTPKELILSYLRKELESACARYDGQDYSSKIGRVITDLTLAPERKTVEVIEWYFGEDQALAGSILRQLGYSA